MSKLCQPLNQAYFNMQVKQVQKQVKKECIK